MKEIGERLRGERIARDVPLEVIKEETKISLGYLHALEEGNFDRLPGDPYIKGFIRGYARAIGIDPDPIIAQYKELKGPTDPLADMERLARGKNRSFLAKVNQTLQWFGL